MNAERNGECEFPGSPSSSTTSIIFTVSSQESVGGEQNIVVHELQEHKSTNFFGSGGVEVDICIGEGEAEVSEQSSLREEGYYSGLQGIIQDYQAQQLLLQVEGSAINGAVLEETPLTAGDVSTAQNNLPVVYQSSRRRPRKTNPITQEVPGPVYTSYTPPVLQIQPPLIAPDNFVDTESSLSEVCTDKEVDEGQSCPLAVPSCIPRYLDSKRKIVTLSPSDVGVKFFKSETGREEAAPFLVSNLLAAKVETFSRVLLFSDIEQPSKIFGPIETNTLVDGAFLSKDPQESIVGTDKILLPKKALIIRHPLLKFGDPGERHFVFPVEKLLEDGSRKLVIQRGFVTRGLEENIQIVFDKEEDIETYLANFSMEQFNNYQLCIPEAYGTEAGYSYDFENGSSLLPTTPLYQQQSSQHSQQQQTAVYFNFIPKIDDRTHNQNGTEYAPILVRLYSPSSNQNLEHVPASIVPTQQQMSVIRATPVNNQTPTSFRMELPNSGNFILRENGEIVENIEGSKVNTNMINTPKQKKPRAAKPRVKASPNVNKSAQNLNITMPNNLRSPDSTNNISGIPFKGFTPEEHQQIVNNNSANPKLTSSVQIESLVTCIAAAADLDTISTINHPSTKSQTSLISSANCKSSSSKRVMSNSNSVPATANTPSVLTMNTEAQIHAVVRKPEEKEEVRTDPRRLDGYLVMCRNCGIGTEDLHICQWCKRKLPPNHQLILDTWKAKNILKTEIAKPPTVSTPSAVPDIKIENHKSTEVEVTNKRSNPRKSKASTPTPAKKLKGGGRRGKPEECIILSSDDEQEGDEAGKANTIPKLENGVCNSSSSSGSPTKGTLGSSLTKTLQVNLTQLKMPLSADGASLAAKPTGPKILLSRDPMEVMEGGGSGPPTVLEPDIDPVQVIAEIESMTQSSSTQGAFTTIDCRSVRIGDYKCVTVQAVRQTYKVVFAKKGILFYLPHAQNKHKIVTCAVPAEKILNIMAHFRHRLPVVFIKTGPKYATWLRKQLGLSDVPTETNYFCSLNGGKCQKYITFLADSFTDMTIVAIKQIYGKTLHELDYVKANELLMSITPNCKMSEGATLNLGQFSDETPSTSSSRNTSTHCLRSTTSTSGNRVVSSTLKPSQTESQLPNFDCSKNKTIMMYNGMPVLQQDILCLADEQFLNDSIIDFWMRYIVNEILTPEERARTYMFSTFFYKRLTTKNKKRCLALEDDPDLSNAEKRHARVKRWTKDVDIFEKDFVIIPINENCHWFLAVICYPGLKGIHDMTTGKPMPDYKKRKAKAKAAAKTAVTIPKKPAQCNSDSKTDVTPPPNDCIPNLDLNEKSTIKEEEISENSDELRIKQPCILIFDSLAGEPRSRVYSTLREYLKIEYKTRKGEEREFTKVFMPAAMPKVPQQPNFCDCGIFTLFYVECFFRWPIHSFDMPMDEMKWYSMEWDKKREEIFKSVKGLVEKICPENLSLIPPLTFLPRPPKETVIRKMQKEQIESAPVEKLKRVPCKEEPMDVDVCASPSTDQADQSISGEGVKTKRIFNSRERTPLRQSITEMVRASPTDNDHDHDYAPIPLRDNKP